MGAGGRPNMSAHFHDHNKGRNYSKAEIQKMRQAEDDLKGKSEKVSDIPEHLSDLAKEYYRFIVNEMEVSGILANLDIPVLSLTCETMAIIRNAEEDINENGLFEYSEDRYGNTVKKKNPAIDIRDKYTSQVKSLLVQLGMTPSARASLASLNIQKEEQEKDPLAQLLKKSQK